MINISCLGNFGRFGNQLHQYCFAKAYAEMYNCELRVPINWIGRKIFHIPEQGIVKNLSRTGLDNVPWGNIDIDLYGYFQNKEHINILSKEKIKRYLQFQDRFKRLKTDKLVCHIRKGDYESKYSNVFAIISKQSYINAVKKFGYNESDIIWCSEENPNINANFERDVSFMEDFLICSSAKILFRANSTFSFWAGLLGDVEKIYSPVVGNSVGCVNVDFIEGNHSKIVSMLEDIYIQ